MNKYDFIKFIREIDFRKDEFVSPVLHDAAYLKLAITTIIQHKDIMVYYHSFEVLKEASHTRPHLFLDYITDFITLLYYHNSYHRDFGLVLLANNYLTSLQ